MHLTLPSVPFPVITSELESAIISDQAGFDAMEREWTHLFDHCRDITPFQSFVWNHTWWSYQRHPCSLALVTVREKGRLVGLGPFAAKRSWGSEHILPIGFDRFAYFGPLVEAGRDDVAQAIATTLAARFHHGLLHIPYFQGRDEALSVIVTCLSSLGWRSCSWVRNVCHFLCESRGSEAFLATKSRKARYNLKRDQKILKEAGSIAFQLFQGPQLNEAIVDRIAGIQARSWLARRNQEPLGSFFYHDLLPALAQSNLAQVYILTLASRDIAFVLNYHHHTENICIYIGFDEAFAHLSPGKVLMHRVIETILDRGDQLLDFHFGDGDYKRFWANRSKYALEMIAWRGTLPYLCSWYPARLRGFMARFPRTKNALKRLMARLRRRFATGSHRRSNDLDAPSSAAESELRSKADKLSSNP